MGVGKMRVGSCGVWVGGYGMWVGKWGYGENGKVGILKESK